ncbi:MAG: hypothetical protein LBU65_17195 [Planctomycetaceae bacterium]|nr:hypothetical protein [Planctomycetaceae bacterium]
MIASNKLYSSYRKKKVLPQRYIPDTLWFASPIYTAGQLNTIMGTF